MTKSRLVVWMQWQQVPIASFKKLWSLQIQMAIVRELCFDGAFQMLIRRCLR